MPSSVKIDRLRFFSLRTSPSSFLVAFSLRMDSFSCATAASESRTRLSCSPQEHPKLKYQYQKFFAPQSFFCNFFCKSSAICCIMFSIEISPLLVFFQILILTLELISIFFSLKTPQLFYTIFVRQMKSRLPTSRTVHCLKSLKQQQVFSMLTFY